MTTSNPTTGQPIKSRANSDAYSDNYDAIFGKKEEEAPATPLPPEVVSSPTVNVVQFPNEKTSSSQFRARVIKALSRFGVS